MCTISPMKLSGVTACTRSSRLRLEPTRELTMGRGLSWYGTVILRSRSAPTVVVCDSGYLDFRTNFPLSVSFTSGQATYYNFGVHTLSIRCLVNIWGRPFNNTPRRFINQSTMPIHNVSSHEFVISSLTSCQNTPLQSILRRSAP